jgi:hypothetical protein
MAAANGQQASRLSDGHDAQRCHGDGEALPQDNEKKAQMKRGKHDFLTADEREAVRTAIARGDSTRDIAKRFNIQPRTVLLYRAGVHGRVVQSRARRQDFNAAFVPRICMRAGCDRAVKDGDGVCDEHRNVSPVLLDNGFVKPPSMARLMAGR